MCRIANSTFFCDSEYIVDLMGAPGTLIPAEVPSSHLQSSGLNLLNTVDTVDQSVKDLCLVLDNVNSQFEKKSQVSERSPSGNNSVSGISCSQLEDKSRAGSSTACDNMRNSGKDHIEKSGNKMPLPTPDRQRCETSGSAEVISPAQQMKVHDVSKYVVTAAKNPEFAQKLHAVLLESGASPPLDLFSDLNVSHDLEEQKDAGDREGKLRSQEAESSNSADDKRKQQCADNDLPDKQGRNHDMYLNLVDTSEPSVFATENRGVLAGVREVSIINPRGVGHDAVLDTAVESRSHCQSQTHGPSGKYEADSSQRQSVSNSNNLFQKFIDL